MGQEQKMGDGGQTRAPQETGGQCPTVYEALRTTPLDEECFRTFQRAKVGACSVLEGKKRETARGDVPKGKGRAYVRKMW